MPYRCAPNVLKPSEQREALLRGNVSWNDAPEAIRSWARLAIYQAAAEIVAADGKGARRNMLGRIPAAIRPLVEAEINRLWALRDK